MDKLSKKVFDKGLEELLTSFTSLSMTKEKAQIWYECCEHLTDEQFTKKVRNCIRYCRSKEPLLADLLDSNGLYQNMHRENTQRITYVN